MVKNIIAENSFTSLLDLSRWIAAFIVFVGHLRNPILSIYPNVEDKNLLVTIFYFITGLSIEAVMVFFVLSGFLVGGKNFTRAKAGTFNLNSYCIDRVSRIYVVLLPAVLLGFFLDIIGSQYFIEAGLYNNTHDIMRNNFPDHVIIEHLNTGLLFSNLFMLQSFYTETLGSNLPLWTLSFEFWFYCLFGLLMITIFKSGKWQIWSLILTGTIVLLLGGKFLLYFFIWCVGLAVGFLNIKIIKNPILALFLFVVFLIVSRLDLIPIQYFADLLVAMSFGIFLLSMKGIHNSFLCKTEKINSILAGFSYSLYLIHFPLMLFLLSVWVSVFDISNFTSGYQPNTFGIMIYVSTIIIVLILSYAFARLTEYHTVSVRRFLKARLLS